MHSHYGFHGEIAQDRQSQLLRDAGANGKAAPHLAVIAADQRAEVAANQQRGNTLNPASKFVFAWSEWRRTRVRLLSGA